MNHPAINKISGIMRNVSDLQRSVIFYQQRLGFQCVGPARPMKESMAALLGHTHRPVQVQCMHLGQQALYLVQAGATARPVDVGGSNDLRFQHFAMPCTDIESTYARLFLHDPSVARARPISHSPVPLPAASGGAVAYKFRDPDGHPLELIQLPETHSAARDPDKEQDDSFDTAMSPRGIDHAAMSVHDAQTSLDFYLGLLGLTIKSRQINVGPEQGALDSLFDPAVDVIGMDVASGSAPHLELLAYQSPRAQRPDNFTQPADLVDILLAEVMNKKGVIMKLAERRYLHETSRDGTSTLLRDPDGHLFVFREARNQIGPDDTFL